MMYSSGLPALKVRESSKAEMLREKRLLRGEITAIQGNVVDSGRVHKVCSQDANIAPKDNRPINRRRVAPTAAGHRPAECRRFGKYYSDALSQFWTGDRGQKTLHAEAYRVAHYHP